MQQYVPSRYIILSYSLSDVFVLLYGSPSLPSLFGVFTRPVPSIQYFRCTCQAHHSLREVRDDIPVGYIGSWYMQVLASPLRDGADAVY
jgi:hypothetical protein